ncbi:MAG: polysaccharide biosynthesis/export family protein [Thermodesulfobacteriota bacterium]|nr:polysaccharide biosynthesis/export family protein [Thermodesulfobacteriota bacterium]
MNQNKEAEYEWRTRKSGRLQLIGLWSLSLLLTLLFHPRLCCALDYTIKSGDVLEISIWGEQELSRKLMVLPDGKVSFPLIGDLKVADKTTAEIKALIENKIETFVPQAKATIIVMELGSLQYYVLGKVARPGSYNTSQKITVLQALALAGGVTTFAEEKEVMILRRQEFGTIALPFNYQEIKTGENLDQNIILERGDVILIP